MPRALQLMLFGLYILVIACFASIVVCEVIFKLNSYPYNTPFLDEYFPDFLNSRARMAFFHTPAFFTPFYPIPFMYPATVAVAYKGFYLFGERALPVFLLFTATVFVASGLLFGRALRRRGFVWTTSYFWPLLVVVCCYPFWFTIKQANMEVITWLLVPTGLFCFVKSRYQEAAICFAIGGAFKIYPIVYLGLLFVRGRYRAIVVGLLVAVGATVFSLWAVGGSIL